MKTTLVCGLLGSGKTTFIQRLVKNAREKTVVLVNDFGKAGIDGEVFSSGGIESVELPSGCVCCTLKFDLVTTVERIIEGLSPKHLVIEPSGVASPSGVVEALALLKISAVTIVGIVDATEFLEIYESQMYGAFFEDQIVNSDIILVNKADLADEETIAQAMGLIGTMNPAALVFPTVNAALDGPLPMVPHRTKVFKDEAPHLHFDTVSLRLDEGLPLARLQRFFAEMADGSFGGVVRAKALIQTDQGPVRFDLSHGKIDTLPFGRHVSDSRLVVIGNGFKKEAIINAIEAIRGVKGTPAATSVRNEH